MQNINECEARNLYTKYYACNALMDRTHTVFSFTTLILIILFIVQMYNQIVMIFFVIVFICLSRCDRSASKQCFIGFSNTTNKRKHSIKICGKQINMRSMLFM